MIGPLTARLLAIEEVLAVAHEDYEDYCDTLEVSYMERQVQLARAVNREPAFQDCAMPEAIYLFAVASKQVSTLLLLGVLGSLILLFLRLFVAFAEYPKPPMHNLKLKSWLTSQDNTN